MACGRLGRSGVHALRLGAQPARSGYPRSRRHAAPCATSLRNRRRLALPGRAHDVVGGGRQRAAEHRQRRRARCGCRRAAGSAAARCWRCRRWRAGPTSFPAYATAAVPNGRASAVSLRCRPRCALNGSLPIASASAKRRRRVVGRIGVEDRARFRPRRRGYRRRAPPAPWLSMSHRPARSDRPAHRGCC